MFFSRRKGYMYFFLQLHSIKYQNKYECKKLQPYRLTMGKKINNLCQIK